MAIEWKAAGPANVWPKAPAGPRAQLAAVIAQMRANESLAAEELSRRQDLQRRSLLGFVIDAVTFYRRLVAQMDPAIRGDLDAVWRVLPVLGAAEVARAAARLSTLRMPPGQEIAGSQLYQGPSGEAIIIPTTSPAAAYVRAAVARCAEWHGWDPAGRLGLASFSSGNSGGAQIADLPDWDLPFETGPATVAAGLKDGVDLKAWLTDKRPDYLMTVGVSAGSNTGGNYLTGLRAAGVRGAVINTSLPAALREVMAARVAGEPVQPALYFAGAGPFATSCAEAGAFHIFPEVALVEIVNDQGEDVDDGDVGDLAITCLQNFAWPVLRFRCGFRARWGASCPCGRTLPVIEIEY